MCPEAQSGKPGGMRNSVALAGFMGAGKSSVGRALAQLLLWNFIDLDEEIELREKRTIPEIFRHDGESAFRVMESEVLRTLLEQARGPTVLALGGGTFIQAQNMDVLRDFGVRVAFLETPLEELVQRCRLNTSACGEILRPLAADMDVFRSLYAARLANYRQAELAVNTAGKSIEEVAREIAVKLGLAASTD
jgi:shikimate kinase